MRRWFFLCLVLSCMTLVAQEETVHFSQQGGKYDNVFPVSLSCDNSAHQIRYTLNGTTPTSSSPIYEGVFLLGAHLFSTSNIYKIRISPPQYFFVPDTILKAVVIRAAVFDNEGNRLGPVTTQSYFIKSLGCDFHGLPVVSICSDSLGLFSPESGIMVPGLLLDTLNPEWTGNYYEHGINWERRSNVEYYDPDNGGFNQEGGLRTHGGNGRRIPQKSFKIYARDQYGKGRFEYKIFENCDVVRFKHLVLKPFRSSWTEAGLQDCLASRIAGHLKIETLAARPVVLFLNGEYWGLYYLQESGDSHYVENHFGIDDDACSVIMNWFGGIQDGDNLKFHQLMDEVEGADLSDDLQYEHIGELMDIHNFLDYQIFEIFSANDDWPANNMRCWQSGESKWRWIFFDGDACFRLKGFGGLANATSESEQEHPTNARATLLFRRLLQNDSFRRQFIERYTFLSKNVFSYANTGSILKDICDEIKQEIPRQSRRFGNPVSISSWNSAVRNVDVFLKDRVKNMTDSVKVFFNIHNSITPQRPILTALYPNPVQDHFTLQFESETYGVDQLRIVDMAGRCFYSSLVYYSEGRNSHTFSIDLPSGTYFVNFAGMGRKIVVAP